MYGYPSGVFKPVVVTTTWRCNFRLLYAHLLLSSPSTTVPGWRRMTQKDIPNALAFVNKNLSQFEIRQVFTSEEEFSHCYLCPAMPNFMYSYIVESNDSITDLVSYRVLYRDGRPVRGVTTTFMYTHTPPNYLMMSTIVSMREKEIESISIRQNNLKSEFLSSFLFFRESQVKYCFYNYKYHEVSQDKFWYSLE